MSNSLSQHLDAILILWLPQDSRLTQSSVWDCFKVAHVFALRTDFQLLKKKFRTTLFWDWPLRVQGNWPDWTLNTGVNF